MKDQSRIIGELAVGPATYHELAAILAIPEDSCRAHMSELVRSGLVVKDGHVLRDVVVRRKSSMYRLAEVVG